MENGKLRTRADELQDSETSLLGGETDILSRRHKILFLHNPVLRYAFALAMVVVAILLRYALSPLLGPGYRIVTIYPVIIIVAVIAGWWPTVLAAVISIIANAYIFADVFDSLVLTSSITVLLTAFIAGWVAQWLHTALDESQQYADTLAQTEQQFRSLFHLAGGGNAEVNAHTYRYMRVNQKFCEITGYSPEELRQLRFTDITHPDDRAKDAEQFERAKHEATQHVSEKRYIRKDGSIRWVHVAASIIFDKDGNPAEAIGNIFDITERKLREIEIHRLNRTLRAISNSSQAMMHATEENSYLQQVCDIIVRDCGHTLVWIGYAENDPGRTIRPVAFSGFEAAYLETFKITWADTEQGRSPIAEAVRTGRPTICKNLQTEPCFGLWRDQALKRGYASAIALPITAHERTFGVLTIYSKEPDPFPSDEIKLLSELTIDLAFGITALRLRAEEEKARSVQRYFRSLFESAPGLYLVLEPEGFKIAAVSDAYLRATMTERPEIMGKGLFEVFTDQPGDPLADGVRNLRASLEHVKASKQADVMAVQRYPIRRPDGSWEERWWSPLNSPVFGPEGQIAYIIHRVEDVTSYVLRMQRQGKESQAWQELEKWQQHLEAEIVLRSQELQRLNNQLRESEETFRLLAEGARAVIGIVQGEHFIYVNPYMEELSGYTREEILQIPIGQMVHPESRAMVLDRARRRQMGEQVETHYEFAMLTKSGEKRWIDFSVNAIHYHGRPAITGIGVDVTDRKRVEEDLKSYRDQLENKNREMESIIGIVSHDLRAPLVNIQGFSNELKMDYKAIDTLLSESPVKKTVEKELDTLLHRTIPESIQYIEGSAQAMNNLVVTLVEVARAGLMPVKPETLDMNSLLRQILASIEIRVKEAAASYDIEDLPPCMADKTHAEQIFRNLLDNALKYLDPNRPGQVCIGGKLQAGSALYWVADNGIGISQEHQDKIFKPYYQLKEKASGGLGMGLATVKKLVDRNQGKIWVVSEKGKYSIFYVALPAPVSIPKN